MHIDLRATRRLTRQIAAAQKRHDARLVASLQAQRRRVDDRFDPNKAIAAINRLVAIGRLMNPSEIFMSKTLQA